MKSPYLLIIILVFVFISCKDKEVYHPELQEADTTILLHRYASPMFPMPDTNRYFLISYVTTLKNERGNEYGNVWFSCKGFPSMDFINSACADYLTYKRKCYQNIIINSITELDNKQDFESLIGKYKGDKIKHKKPCP